MLAFGTVLFKTGKELYFRIQRKENLKRLSSQLFILKGKKTP